jgi:hypothetical protein
MVGSHVAFHRLIDRTAGLAQNEGHGDEHEGFIIPAPAPAAATALERPYFTTCQETIDQPGADPQGRP